MILSRKSEETLEAYLSRALPIYFKTEVIPYLKRAKRRDDKIMKVLEKYRDKSAKGKLIKWKIKSEVEPKEKEGGGE